MDFNATLNASARPEHPLGISPQGLKTILLVQKYAIIVIVVSIMFGMGCAIELNKAVLELFKKPVGIIIGLLSQFVVMPAVAAVVIAIFSFSGPVAIAVTIVATCPGGVTSNLLTFISRGDIALSVAMTTASTVLALGLMPLNMFLYASKFSTSVLKIPYVKILISLVQTVVPVAIGLYIRRKWPRVAAKIAVIGPWLGMFVIGFTTVLQILYKPRSFLSSWTFYVSGPITMTFAYLFGHLLAMALSKVPVCGLNRILTAVQFRTIGFETMAQNLGVALLVISQSFEPESRGPMLIYAFIYKLFYLILGFGMAFAYRAYFQRQYRKNQQKAGVDNQMNENNEKQQQGETNQTIDNSDQLDSIPQQDFVSSV